jgi:hypothetical protein
MRSLVLFSVVAVFASLAVTGCGSSGRSPLTAGELASQGNAICERAKSEEDALRAQNVQGMRLAIPRLEEIGARELTGLSKLSPPASEQSSYHELLKTASEVDALLKPLSAALVTDGSAPQELLAHGRELTSRLAALTGPLDLSSCSSSSAG